MTKPEYVRVTDADTDQSYSVVSTAVEAAHSLVKDEPATDGNGDPLPPSPLAKATAKKKESS